MPCPYIRSSAHCLTHSTDLLITHCVALRRGQLVWLGAPAKPLCRLRIEVSGPPVRFRASAPASASLLRAAGFGLKLPACVVCASPWMPLPPFPRALAWPPPVCARPPRQRAWRSAPYQGRTSRRGLGHREAWRRPTPASPVAPPCPHRRSTPTRSPRVSGREVRVADRTARRCHTVLPRHAYTCQPSRDNCTKAGSPPVKETGRGFAGRSAP